MTCSYLSWSFSNPSSSCKVPEDLSKADESVNNLNAGVHQIKKHSLDIRSRGTKGLLLLGNALCANSF